MKPASDKQIAFLKNNGIEGSKMSAQEAHKAISEILGDAPALKPAYPAQTTHKFEYSDKKERLIVRQSCLKAAIEYYDKQPDGQIVDVLDMAEEFEDWVFRD